MIPAPKDSPANTDRAPRLGYAALFTPTLTPDNLAFLRSGASVELIGRAPNPIEERTRAALGPTRAAIAAREGR